MLKIYRLPNGRTYQYEEGTQPEGAVEVKKAVEPPAKAVVPENKAKKTANKAKAVKSK